MAIPLPNLDDRTYAELTAEARALIPSLHPAWTNHNPSDPGIVLVELLAWLTEMLLFQVNEITPASTRAFLQLLNDPERAPVGMSPDEAILWTKRDLRERYRAITPDDYEHLALHTWPTSEEAKGLDQPAGLARVRCVAQRNLEAPDAGRDLAAPAHVSLVVVPDTRGEGGLPVPTPELLTKLAAFFAPRLPLTTRLHVVGPSYVDVGVRATLALHEDAPPATALDEAARSLAAFFDPLTGGADGGGWPLGRHVHPSEAYAALEQVALVDYVEDVQVTGSVELDAHQLVHLGWLDLVAYDTYGHAHHPATGMVPS